MLNVVKIYLSEKVYSPIAFYREHWNGIKEETTNEREKYGGATSYVNVCIRLPGSAGNIEVSGHITK